MSFVNFNSINRFLDISSITNVSGEIEKRISFLITARDENKFDVKNQVEFKESKKILKELVKQGLLSEEQRALVLTILCQKGQESQNFKAYQGDFRFRGLTFAPTKVLFFSPTLWNILYFPENYPEKAQFINLLTDAEFKILINTINEKELENLNIQQLAKMAWIGNCLDIPEVQQLYAKALDQQIENILSKDSLQIHTLYTLAAVWKKESDLFMKLLISHSTYLEGIHSKEEMVLEFNDFNQAKISIEPEWLKFSPLKLYRFFYFIQSQIEDNPRLSSLSCKVFDKLLAYLKSRELEAKYSAFLVRTGQHSLGLNAHLKQDNLPIFLKNSNRAAGCMWLLFAKSEYFRLRMTSNMKAENEIDLNNITDKSFFCLYNLWMNNKPIPIDSLSAQDLIDLLVASDYLQLIDFEETRIKIAKALIEQADQTKETMTALAELTNSIYSPELEAHIVSWLKSFSFLFIKENKNNKNKYDVEIDLTTLPTYEALQSGIQVLKILYSNQRLSIIKLGKIILEDRYDKPLVLLAQLYCSVCLELEEKATIETELLSMKKLDRSKDRDEWSKFDLWGPYDFLALLNSLGDETSNHLFKLSQSCSNSSSFWTSIDLCTEKKSFKEFQSLIFDFEKIISDPLNQFSLKPNDILLFLLFLSHHNNQNKAREKALINSLEWKINWFIKTKDFKINDLFRLLYTCEKFYPKSSVFDIEIKIKYTNLKSCFDLYVSLYLLSISTTVRELLLNDQIGKKENIPFDYMQWAIRFIHKTQTNFFLISNLEEIKNFKDAKLIAYQQLLAQFKSWELSDIKKQNQKLSKQLLDLLTKSPDETTALAIAPWFAANSAKGLSECVKIYCPSHLYVRATYEDKAEVTLLSSNSKALKMLEAMGSAIKMLEIKKSESKNLNWEKIQDACPNINQLTIYMHNLGDSLKTLSLEKFHHLECLKFHVEDLEEWKALKLLKIPSQIPEVHISISKLSYLEQAPYYEFFNLLSGKRIALNIKDDDIVRSPSFFDYFITPPDPLDLLVSCLMDFKDIEIKISKDSPMLIERITNCCKHLETLYLDFNHRLPTVAHLEMIKNLPYLKKFRIDYYGYEKSSLTDELTAFMQQWKNECGNTKDLQYRLK
jgi:hypothetical protein